MSRSPLERRLERLEDRIGSVSSADPAERERQRAAFDERLQIVREKAAREETEGKPQRRIALESLLESISRRRRG
jgi:hypothetical protein